MTTVIVSLDFELLLESSPSLPEKRLLVAIIHRAVLDFQGHDAQAYQQHEAARWLFSDGMGPMSLHWVCTWLTEDPRWLQQAIQQMVKGAPKKKWSVMRVDK